MGRIFVLVCAFFMIFTLVAHAQEESAIDLAFVGDILGPGPFPESTTNWFAIHQTPIGMLVTPTRIEVSRVDAICGDFATRIRSIDVEEPLFLVRGIPSIQVGRLDSVFEEPHFIFPAELLSFQLASDRWFGFVAYGAASPDVGGTRVSDYEIRMFQGANTQTLAEFPVISKDGPPQLLWAGDLDADGNMDGLFDLRTHYAGHSYVLFLSSSATDDQLVSRVAEFTAGGC